MAVAEEAAAEEAAAEEDFASIRMSMLTQMEVVVDTAIAEAQTVTAVDHATIAAERDQSVLAWSSQVVRILSCSALTQDVAAAEYVLSYSNNLLKLL